MTDITTSPSPEEIAQHYSAALDSVNLITLLKNNDANTIAMIGESEVANTIARNVSHLEIQVAKGAEFYGSHDLTPLTTAINL
jgi:hypothetical protein